jgi:hypothetical protein
MFASICLFRIICASIHKKIYFKRRIQYRMTALILELTHLQILFIPLLIIDGFGVLDKDSKIQCCFIFIQSPDSFILGD